MVYERHLVPVNLACLSALPSPEMLRVLKNETDIRIADDILARFVGLEQLRLCSGAFLVTASMFQHMPNLRVLVLENCQVIADDAFCHLQNLTSLRLVRCFRIEDHAFRHLGNYLSDNLGER
eukprot:GILJ01007041.1.p3 GENE.GILJ01007041.1~~GILJ01007041.1.p3  ORF type:complete len:122 (+),score=10.77 GILJ01007041.1:1157-1522(+)